MFIFSFYRIQASNIKGEFLISNYHAGFILNCCYSPTSRRWFFRLKMIILPPLVLESPIQAFKVCLRFKTSSTLLLWANGISGQFPAARFQDLQRVGTDNAGWRNHSWQPHSQLPSIRNSVFRRNAAVSFWSPFSQGSNLLFKSLFKPKCLDFSLIRRFSAKNF